MMKRLLIFMTVWAAFNVNAQEEILFQDPFPLPDIINSEAEEIQPVFSKDSSHLYFVRMFHEENEGGKESGDQDIWVAIHDENGDWVKVENMDVLNNSYNNSVFGINADGSTIYLLNAYLKKKKSLEKGVAIAHKKGNSWEHHPEKLPIEDFVLHGDHYGFHINETEDIIVISDAGEGTLGKEDLYVTRKGPDGKWHKPIHLGSDINTEGYEISPYLSPKGDTLYFSTDGRSDGYGEADIYYSIRKDETWQSWTTPKNLGPKINSANFDAYFIRSENDCYFSSDRGGNNDIYHAHVYIPPPPPILFNIYASTDPTQPEGTDGTITLYKLEPNFTYDRLVFYHAGDSTVLTDVTADEEGQYKVTGLPEGLYDNFRTYFGKYVATCPDDATLKDPVIVKPEPKFFEEVVYFDLNSSYLRTDAKNTINEMVPKIKKETSYKITITAHTDKRATNSYNEWLSMRRLERVKDYLISKGIKAEVISGEYHGEDQPVHDCEECDESKHQENRRAEIKVEILQNS